MLVPLPVTVAVVGALAAPRFVGEPDDVRLAEIAWEAARVCTGRDGAAAEVVEIVRRVVPGDYLGVARTDPAGRLYRIDLNTEPARLREVVVHEVSHAWVSEGPVALVEGTAELIADCIVRRVPGLAPLQYDDGRDLSGLPDLLAWSKPTEGAPSELHAVRTDAYLGAARLLRTAELVVEGEVLWADRRVDWPGFEAALLAADADPSSPSRPRSSRGRELVDVLHAGAAAQRAALQDDDRDGLTALAESWLGTSDRRFDTDDDGWADPALLGLPEGARTVPLDATPVCTGTVAPPAEAVGVVPGGNLRGAVLPGLIVRRAPGEGARPVLVGLTGSPGIDTTGAAWVVPSGTRSAAGCASTARTTVWAEDPALQAVVDGFSARLEQALARSEARLGLGPQRVAVALGGARTTVQGEVVWLSSADVRSTDLDHLARVAVAARRLWVAGERDWSAAEAVARSFGAPGP